MSQRYSYFFIADKDCSAVLEATRNIAAPEPRFRGEVSPHWAWTTMDEIRNARNLEEAFRAWRWEPVFGLEANPDITDIQFEGEKSGDDMVFFKAIAPYVRDGSYIEMQGEDGHLWRWKFNNGKVSESHSRIVWDDE
jgi:hypothetical protein